MHRTMPRETCGSLLSLPPQCSARLVHVPGGLSFLWLVLTPLSQGSIGWQRLRAVEMPHAPSLLFGKHRSFFNGLWFCCSLLFVQRPQKCIFQQPALGSCSSLTPRIHSDFGQVAVRVSQTPRHRQVNSQCVQRQCQTLS